MNRDDITPHIPELKVFMRTLRTFSFVLIMISLVGYALSFWLWSEGHLAYAVMLTSTIFAIFYLLRNQLIEISSRYLSQDQQYEAMLEFINKHRDNKNSKAFIEQLDKAITIIEKTHH